MLLQNSEIVLYNLSKKAQDEKYQFERLYRNLYNEDFYYKAYTNIYANQGSATKGIDKETADGFGSEKINSIIQSLKDESYQPKPARRIYIPKKNGQQRPLGIPSFTDRIVQEICRMLLEAIYESEFSSYSHGFRPKKGCHTALKQIQDTFSGVNWFIEGDIKGFFDNIDHHTLINILRRRIKDEKLIRLMWKFLKAGYLEEWKYSKTYAGTPQGGIISPILANIYLNEFDQYMLNVLKKDFDTGKPKSRKRNREYRHAEYLNGKLKKRIDETTDEEERNHLIKEYKHRKKNMLQMPYYDYKNEGFKSIKYVRYADDFIVGVNGGKEDCLRLKEQMREFLHHKLKLELSDEKTLITHSGKEAKFLSYGIKIKNDQAVKRDKNGTTKRVYNDRVQLLIPKGTIEKIIVERKMVKDINAKEWKILHRPALRGLTALEIVETYNAELRGLYNYFCMAENVTHKMWQLRYVMEYSCLKTLAGKYRTKISVIKERYRQGKHWGIPYETKKGKKVAMFFNEPLIRKTKATNIDADSMPNLYVYQCTTELEQRLKASKCEICGCNDPDTKYEVHHVNKVKNLKEKTFWEKIMIAKQRKTLIVCQECHIKIHKG